MILVPAVIVLATNWSSGGTTLFQTEIHLQDYPSAPNLIKQHNLIVHHEKPKLHPLSIPVIVLRVSGALVRRVAVDLKRERVPSNNHILDDVNGEGEPDQVVALVRRRKNIIIKSVQVANVRSHRHDEGL